MFSGLGPVNVVRTLAGSPGNRGATGRRRSGKPQFRAQARPSSFSEPSPPPGELTCLILSGNVYFV